jgi:DNA-binding LacI/PurR family transcriptional regulator
LERRRGDGTYICENVPPKTACLVLDYMDDIHSMFPYIIQKLLFEAGYIVTVFDTVRISRNKETLGAYLSNYPELLIIDGLNRFPFELLNNVPETTKKIIFQRCETKPVFDASYVLVDIEECGYQAAKQLLLSGRKRIGIITKKCSSKYDQDSIFLSGAIRAINEHKVKTSVNIEHIICWRPEDISEVRAMEILQSDKRPDGIMADADCKLISFIKAAKKLGISIPEELSLIGRCNTPWAEEYKLTSLDIQPNLIVKKIRDILNLHENKKIMVAPKMIFRDSCPSIIAPNQKTIKNKEKSI